MLSATVLKDITPRRLGFPKKKKFHNLTVFQLFQKSQTLGTALRLIFEGICSIKVCRKP